MNISAKITERLTFLEVIGNRNHMFSCRGVSRLGCVHLKQPYRSFAGVCAKTVSSLEGSDSALRNGTGVVLPATDEFADHAIQSIKSGKVIAVPTDTLYGFACDACSRDAVNRIYEIKGRNLTSPLAIWVGDVSDIKRFAFTHHLPETLFDALLPGPVTLIMRRVQETKLLKS